jgi:hypothetical protein
MALRNVRSAGVGTPCGLRTVRRWRVSRPLSLPLDHHLKRSREPDLEFSHSYGLRLTLESRTALLTHRRTNFAMRVSLALTGLSLALLPFTRGARVLIGNDDGFGTASASVVVRCSTALTLHRHQSAVRRRARCGT